MFGQQLSQSSTPMGIGRHHFQQHFDHDSLRVKTARVRQLGGILLGDNRLDRVGAIPEALVMRGQIAQVGNGMKPRRQHAAIEPERFANRLLLVPQQVLEHLRHGAEGQHLEHHP
nr:hypothetical protein [Propionivibrio sp.]